MADHAIAESPRLMGRSDLFSLNPEEIQVIETAIREEDRPEVCLRSTAILMLHLGTDVSKVADLFSISPGTVYNWHRRWREDGIDGLANRPKTGRPPLADDEYRQAMHQALDSTPGAFGYGSAGWTLELLLRHLERVTGVRLSASRLRVIMKEEGYDTGQLSQPQPSPPNSRR